ncbi:MAG: 6-hydroxymethylpterin diphosphokinase MptE-like protein [Thermoplasmata archaeon]
MPSKPGIVNYIVRTGGKVLPEELLAELSIDPGSDRTSAMILSGMIAPRDEDWQSMAAHGTHFLVVGPNFSGIPEQRKDYYDMIIVADSAIDAFYDLEGCPDIIVTDLDGNPALISGCAREGSAIVVHAHGDNTAGITGIVPSLRGLILGTCQVDPPVPGLRNIGGFTDGDRSAYLADYLGARTITLAGFDFENPAFKPGTDIARKRLKLAWAKTYLEALAVIRGRKLVRGDVIEI